MNVRGTFRCSSNSLQLNIQLSSGYLRRILITLLHIAWFFFYFLSAKARTHGPHDVYCTLDLLHHLYHNTTFTVFSKRMVNISNSNFRSHEIYEITVDNVIFPENKPRTPSFLCLNWFDGSENLSNLVALALEIFIRLAGWSGTLLVCIKVKCTSYTQVLQRFNIEFS